MDCFGSPFGPVDPREITYRLSQRIALFLNSDRTQAGELFKKVKDGYHWRSKIVRGLHLGKLKEDKSKELMCEIESVARNSLIRILSERSLTQEFNSKKRENYLDGLVFQAASGGSSLTGSKEQI